jgi:hypothetical protein
MVFSLSISAGAAVSPADINANGGSTSQTVTVKVVPTTSETYHVVVKWTDTTFTYSFADQEWDAETHQYAGGNPSWDKTKATVTVINHSNVAVNATVQFEDGTDSAVMINNVTASLDKTSLPLGTGVGTGAGEDATGGLSGNATQAPAGTVTLSITGNPEANAEVTASKQITVKINKA